MDVGAFVQENKRWLLGCAIGGVVWLVAGTIVGNLYDWTNPNAKALGAPQGEIYDSASRGAAAEENARLVAERQRLQQVLAFEPTAKYQLAGQGQPSEYLLLTSRDLRDAILAGANRRDVQIQESSLVWDTPTQVDEVRATLFALELVDEVQQRLFAAHDATRAAAEEATGLRQILSIRVEARRGQKNQSRVRPGEVDIRDFLDQEQVSFQFQADEPTIQAFCESLRKPGRALVLDAWTLNKPAKPGEPCTVKGTVVGLAFKKTEAAAGATAGSENGGARGSGAGAGGK